MSTATINTPPFQNLSIILEDSYKIYQPIERYNAIRSICKNYNHKPFQNKELFRFLEYLFISDNDLTLKI